MPILQFAGQLGALRRGEVEDAAADGGLDFETGAGGDGVCFAERGEAVAGGRGHVGDGNVSTYWASASMKPPRFILACEAIAPTLPGC